MPLIVDSSQGATEVNDPSARSKTTVPISEGMSQLVSSGWTAFSLAAWRFSRKRETTTAVMLWPVNHQKLWKTANGGALNVRVCESCDEVAVCVYACVLRRGFHETTLVWRLTSAYRK